MQISDAVANAMLDAIETVIGAWAKLELRTGSAPANTVDSDSGTLLCELSLPSDWLANAASRAKGKNGAWIGTAVGNGTAQHYRIKISGGTCHLQGPVSYAAAAWAGSTSYTIGQRRRNGGNVYICVTAGTSASSGGPSGTGSGITDGSVVWDYVQAYAEVQCDNINIAIDQFITVTTFTITAGNA